LGTEATIVRSGLRSYKLGDTGTTDQIGKATTSTISSGDYYTVLFPIRFSALTVAGGAVFSFGNNGTGTSAGGNGAFSVRFASDSSGDFTIHEYNDNTTVQATLAATSHNMAVDTWYIWRVDVYFHATAGKVKLTVNGASAEATNIDTTPQGDFVSFRCEGASLSYYIDCVAAWETGGVYAPTDLPDDIAKTSPYQTGDPDRTDMGNDLNSDDGVWSDVGNLPWTGGTRIENTSSGHYCGTTCDDGSRTGPSGDSDVTGATILGAVLGVWADRGNGGGTTHYLYYGSDQDTLGANWYTNCGETAVTVGSTASYIEHVFEGALVPTSSEYAVWGFRADGARQWRIYDASYVLLYEPAAGGSFPPINPYRFRHMLVR
jgi:hypothetical protein